MTVSELMNLLADLDPDAEVWMPCPTGGEMRLSEVEPEEYEDGDDGEAVVFLS